MSIIKMKIMNQFPKNCSSQLYSVKYNEDLFINCRMIVRHYKKWPDKTFYYIYSINR